MSLTLDEENLIIEKLKDSQVSFWIDSSGGPKDHCNFSSFGTNPKYYFYGFLNEVNVIDCESGAISFIKENCFDFLEEKLSEEKHNPNGVFVGYLAYDLFHRIEQLGMRSEQSKVNSQSLILNPQSYKPYPDFVFAYFENSYQQEAGSKKIMSHASCLMPPAEGEARQGRQSSCLSPHASILASNMTDSEYLEKVKQIKEEIKAGNVYQVNLTREYSLEHLAIDELELYLKLRSTSPNPYGCYFKTPFLSILSSSPEEFLYVSNQQHRIEQLGMRNEQNRLSSQSSILNPKYIRTCPIKGTLSKDTFVIDPKNQAENIMIVDLERNDLGRICEYGSIQAKKLLEIESYEHLNHVVSTIEGKLKKDIKLKEIFEALFPGGSITGAPKIAAMNIIDKIETTKRGAYTGSFGYIKTDGTMNFNILIRTIFIQDDKLIFNIGGGIVADSDPQSELEEIHLKAKGIMSALGLS